MSLKKLGSLVRFPDTPGNTLTLEAAQEAIQMAAQEGDGRGSVWMAWNEGLVMRFDRSSDPDRAVAAYKRAWREAFRTGEWQIIGPSYK